MLDTVGSVNHALQIVPAARQPYRDLLQLPMTKVSTRHYPSILDLFCQIPGAIEPLVVSNYQRPTTEVFDRHYLESLAVNLPFPVALPTPRYDHWLQRTIVPTDLSDLLYPLR